MLLTRRLLFGGVAALLAAPAVVRVESLMPVKAIPPYGRSPGMMVLDEMTRYRRELIAAFEANMEWLRDGTVREDIVSFGDVTFERVA